MLSNFGPFAQELEGLTTSRIGVECRVVVSGDIGLVIAIAALGLPEGSSVIVPSFTFNSTVNAVLWNRLRPVFVDIDPDTFHIDPHLVEDACSRSDAKLIIATHVFGAPADVDELELVASSAKARLLFDAAHAYGASHDGRAIGSFGDAEVFSLSGTKPVTSAEGGLISSQDDEFLEKVGYLRAYGFRQDYNSRFVGLNGKMSELHAALGLLTLSRVEDALVARSALVERYKNALGSLSGLTYQVVGNGDTSTYKDFALLFPDAPSRLRAQTALAEAQVQTKRYFLPCHTMDAFRSFVDSALPVTQDVYERALCIPLFEDISDPQLSRVIRAIDGSWDAQ